MRIISKTKDYYDWVAGKYGGGDPRVIYGRRSNVERDGNVIKKEFNAQTHGFDLKTSFRH